MADSTLITAILAALQTEMNAWWTAKGFPGSPPTMNDTNKFLSALFDTTVGSGNITSPTFDETWHIIGAAGEPSFQNAWGNFGSGYPNAAFRIDGYGFVHLSGMISGGTLPNAAFTLPVGYRPSARVLLSTGSNNAWGRCDILATGEVQPTAGTNAWMTLDGLIFHAEQ